jgi:peptidyl serine alpha-galactosyltransferase
MVQIQNNRGKAIFSAVSGGQKKAILKLFMTFAVLGCVIVMHRDLSRDLGIHHQDNVQSQHPSPLSPMQSQREASVHDENVHIVLSTGCTPHQHWQSYVFFYHAMVSGQRGQVTRIASGCSDDEALELQRLHQEQIVATMSDRFHLYFTTEYNNVIPGKYYNFFNRAYALRHWMTNELKYSEKPDLYDDTVFVLLDPDQIILRPFVRDYTDQKELWHTPDGFTKVARGQTMAQAYDMGAEWRTMINMTHILGSDAPSSARTWTDQDILDHFMIGAPYIAVGYDMYRIASTWAEFSIPVYEVTNGAFLTEMYAYSAVVAHLDLPPQLANSFMVSNVVAYGEAWWWIDDDSNPQVCGNSVPLPHTLHLCQVYDLGPYHFYKYDFPYDFLSCEHPLMLEPGPEIADLYNSSITHYEGVAHKLDPLKRKRMAFALCQLIPRINAAATHYKQHHCSPETANFKKTFLVHNPRIEKVQ